MDDFEKDLDEKRLDLFKKYEPHKILKEILASMHGDGGHFTEKHGIPYSAFVAENRFANFKQRIRENDMQEQDFNTAVAKFIPIASQDLIKNHSAMVFVDKMGYNERTNFYVLSLEIKELEIDEEGTSFETLGMLDLGFSRDYTFSDKHFPKFIYNKVSQHIESLKLREEIQREKTTLNMYNKEWLKHKQKADDYDSKIKEKRKRVEILQKRIQSLKPL